MAFGNLACGMCGANGEMWGCGINRLFLVGCAVRLHDTIGLYYIYDIAIGCYTQFGLINVPHQHCHFVFFHKSSLHFTNLC
jgi:hypothetical protein